MSDRPSIPSNPSTLSSKGEFNLSYLLALDFINPLYKHLSSGSEYRPPNLRLTLLRAVKDDIALFGLPCAIEKQKFFIRRAK